MCANQPSPFCTQRLWGPTQRLWGPTAYATEGKCRWFHCYFSSPLVVIILVVAGGHLALSLVERIGQSVSKRFGLARATAGSSSRRSHWLTLGLLEECARPLQLRLVCFLERAYTRAPDGSQQCVSGVVDDRQWGSQAGAQL